MVFATGSAGGRRGDGGGALRLGCRRGEVGGVVVGVGPGARSGWRRWCWSGRVRERCPRRRSRCAVTDEVDDRRVVRRARWPWRQVHHARAARHGEGARRVGCGQGARRGGAGRLGDQLLPVCRDAAGQRGDAADVVPAAQRCCTLRPSRDRRSRGVLQLDEVVGVRRAGVPAAAVHLADDEPRAARRGRRDEGERRGDERESHGGGGPGRGPAEGEGRVTLFLLRGEVVPEPGRPPARCSAQPGGVCVAISRDEDPRSVPIRTER